MAYQVIARKWRPQTFADVVGQVHITQTLANALKNDRIHHALLFTGPRGTGKTSSARILAKALRCPNVKDFVPCNECPSCLEIAAGRSLDVQELDAASNNSVDDIRKLLEGVMNAPSSGRWKIYIVDEVHMLSTSAFNALLKTLEEPPAHVMFILATTEVHKIPETILSRCQRFDFKRIPTRQITDHLRRVCEGENVVADDESLWMIARQGDGSMRDAQSLLDQVITFSSGSLDKAAVARILGLTDRGLLFDALKLILARDTHGMLKILERFALAGIEPKMFANELLETLRHLLIVKISGAEMTSILDLPDSELKEFADLGAPMSEEEVHFLFDMALKGANDLPRAHDPRLVLEVLMLRMAAAPRILDLQSLLGANPQPRGELRPPSAASPTERPAAPVSPRPAAPTKPVAASAPVKPTAAAAQTTRPSQPAPAPAPVKTAPSAPVQTQAPTPPPAAPTKAEGKTPQDRWLSFVDLVRAQDAFFAAKIENLVFNGEENRTIRLAIPPKLVFLRDQMADADVRRKFKGYVDSLWGQGYSFEVVSGRETPKGDSAQTMATKKRDAHEEELRTLIADHPLVKAVESEFGAKIKSVTAVKEGANK